MWVLNPLYASTSGTHFENNLLYSSIVLKINSLNDLQYYYAAFSESETSYRTRSLPAWGKGRQRPVTAITDDIATLYVKVK